MSTHGTIKRFTLIIQKVSTGAFPSFEDIKEGLEEHGFNISKRTLQRDIEQIRNEFGIEILYKRSKNGYTISNQEDIPTETLVRFLEILGTAESLSEGLKDGRDLLNFISFEDQGNLKGVENLRPIILSIKNKRKIEFYHTNFESGKRTLYTLQPYLLREYQSRWYVFGVIDSKTNRTFGLDRIDGIKLKSEKFKPNPNFNAKVFFEDIIGLNYSDSQTEEVLIETDLLQSKYLKALPLHHSQKPIKEENNKIVFQYFLKPNFELIQKVLTMCDRAKVLKPKWLADEIKSILKESLKNYGK